MLEKIGFFSFLADYERPFDLLNEAICTCGDTARNSLIVLPEAFNYGRSYSEKGHCPRFTKNEAVRILSELSERHRITFVVGLLDPPDNSAFLIRYQQARLLRKKTTTEHTEQTQSNETYKPCSTDCGGEPILCEGVYISALICNEITEESARGPIIEKLEKCGGHTKKVICVPAHITSGYIYDPRAPRWHCNYVALANSMQKGARSFVAKGGVQGRKFEEPDENHGKLFLREWSDLEEPTSS